MQMKLLTAVLMGFALLGAGCQSAPEKAEAKAAAPAKAQSPEAASAAKAIADAKAAQKKAASVEGEWRDTGKTIKKAEAALKAGKYADATKLANKARVQGEDGYAQAMSQKDFKMPAYLN
jgi:uncharacterized membrane protein (UPF0182 family)